MDEEKPTEADKRNAYSSQLRKAHNVAVGDEVNSRHMDAEMLYQLKRQADALEAIAAVIHRAEAEYAEERK